MATNPKDEHERLNQQPGALVAGNTIVSTPPKGAAVSNDPNNAAKFAKVPEGIGGNPVAASKPATPAASPPPAAAPVAVPGATDPQRTSAMTSPAFVPAAQMASPAMAQPPKPAAASGPGFMQGVRDVYNQSSNEIASLASQGRYGAALGETGRAALAYIPAVADDVIGGAVRAVGPAIMDAGKQFLGISSANAQPAQASAAAQGQQAQTATKPWDQDKLAGQLGGLDKEMAAQSRLASVMSPTDSGIAAQEVSGQNPMTSFDRTGMTNAQVAQANPAGRVTMQRQPNGTMSFSGGDVSGPVSYANSAGNPLVGSGIRGTGFSRVDSAQAGTAVGMDGAGNYAFTSGNPIAGAAGDSRSPVGMPVEQAQREGLVGQRVGYNPAFDQRLNGAQGQASMSATTSSGVDAALAAAAGRGDFDAVRAHYAGRGQETSAQAIAQQPQAGFTGSIGQPIDNGGAWGRTPEQQRKDAETQASSIHKQTAERGAAALKSLDGREAVNAKAQAEMQQELLRQSGALQREGMRNQSEDFRTASQNRLAAAELAQRYRDSDAQNEIRNLEAANARRTAGIKERFDNATSEAERMSIIRQYPDVFGQKSVQGKDRYITVGGGTSVVDGQTVREPTTVFDTLTQQYVGGGAPGGGQAGQQAKAPEYEKGQVYVDPQSGSQRRWNGTGWERV